MPTAATLTEAFSAIDAALSAKDVRSPAQLDADFRAHHRAAARKLIADLRAHREWVGAHSAANPVGPSVSCFYRELAPERIARRMAEVARHRRLAARGSLTLATAVA